MTRWSRRDFVGAGLATAAASGLGEAAHAEGEALTPEMFGAKGDGRTNDSLAFDELSRRINERGGGVVALRKTIYSVGRPLPPSPSFKLSPILQFLRCSRGVTVRGNGAVLRCGAGLPFGTFDRTTGAPIRHPMPYFGNDAVSPYTAMIFAEECSGPILISDLELDGNLTQLRIGGPYGDGGYQIPGSGIFLRNNRGDEIVRNVHTHHHPQDGLMIDGVDDPALAKRVTRRIEGVRSEYNGRQGCSVVGGAGYAFSQCRFNHTGRAGVSSPPGAGVDIEAEGDKRNRNLSFAECTFIDNSGCGMVADSGPSEGASFSHCTFVGTTSWSAWPNKPGFSFRDCLFVGALCHAAAVADRRLSTMFIGCTFVDDPARSPTGKVYLASGSFGAIADLNELGNPIFEGCRFVLTHNAQLPWSMKATYRDCVMTQASPRQAYPRGLFEGRNIIRGNVDLYGSQVPGEVTINGKLFAHRHF